MHGDIKRYDAKGHLLETIPYSHKDKIESYREYRQLKSKSKKENPGLIERGIFVQDERPEYCSEYDKLIEKAMKGH